MFSYLLAYLLRPTISNLGTCHASDRIAIGLVVGNCQKFDKARVALSQGGVLAPTVNAVQRTAFVIVRQMLVYREALIRCEVKSSGPVVREFKYTCGAKGD